MRLWLVAVTMMVAAQPSLGQVCGDGGRPLDEIVAVSVEVALRKSPDGERVKNEKASAALGTVRYQQIDSTTTVQRVCEQGDWSEVKVVEPKWLRSVSGWVPTSSLRVIERGRSGKRIYVESDFYWDNETSKYKPQIVAIVNKIASEHKGCSAVDTGTVAKSSSKSRPNDPVFFVTCRASPDFNVWFRPGDVDKTFGAVSGIGKGNAALACESAAKRAAVNPSTVNFSAFLSASFLERQDGRSVLESAFTAKNNLGFQQKFNIRCVFDGQELIESAVSDHK